MTEQTMPTTLIVSVNSKKLDANLIKLENAIRTAEKSFLITGENLTLINEGKLYKQRGFTTFELYVSTMFDFTRDYAYKIMNATRIYNVIKKNFKPSELPRAETHCRPLNHKDIDDASIVKIWGDVVKTNKIIAKTVIQMVNLHLGKGDIKPEPPVETTNNEGEGGTAAGETEADGITAAQEVLVLKAEITRLENELEKARSNKGGIAATKMAREMILKGFAAMSQTVTEDQKSELVATKKALLG